MKISFKSIVCLQIHLLNVNDSIQVQILRLSVYLCFGIVHLYTLEFYTFVNLLQLRLYSTFETLLTTSCSHRTQLGSGWKWGAGPWTGHPTHASTESRCWTVCASIKNKIFLWALRDSVCLDIAKRVGSKNCNPWEVDSVTSCPPCQLLDQSAWIRGQQPLTHLVGVLHLQLFPLCLWSICSHSLPLFLRARNRMEN